MSFETRSPSVKLTVEKEAFNKLITILDYNFNLGIDFANFSSIANKLKEKILTYSVPRLDTQGNEYADVRFYPIEASNMISQLLVSKDDIEINQDYYQELTVRKK